MHLKRDITWNAEHGLGLLRWCDSLDTIRAHYPDAVMKGGAESRHPLTGDVMRIPPSPHLDRLVITPEGFSFSALCTLNEETAQLEEVALSSTSKDPHAAAASFAKLMSVGPVEKKRTQKFERGFAQIELILGEDVCTFTVSKFE